MSKILRINTRTCTAAFEELGDYAGLGGRAMTSRIVRAEVPPDCHPLSAENKLIFSPGLLTGTKAANSGRLSVGAKSPLTMGIKESNSGGLVSAKLAKMGIMAVVFEDKPAEDAPFSVVKITKDGVEFADAPATDGQGTYAYYETMKATYGDKPCVAMIGAAGEQCLKAASIQISDLSGRPLRSAGRGGMGAVMGSKRIKAIVVDDTGAERMTYADPDGFSKATKRWAEILKEHPVTGQGLPAFGTSVLVNIINEAGALPTKNFRYGRFDHAADVSGEKIAELIEKRGGKTREGCHVGCMIQCSQVYNDEKGEYLTSGFEYETVWGFGPNSLINDIDDIAMLDRTCDELGLDTIEMANTVAVSMDGGVIPWADGKAALGLLNEVGKGSPLGKIIGNGARFAGDAFGVERVAVVKNQSLPAYDPRAVKGVGVTYATTPMGADHTAGYAVCQNILKVGGDVDPLSKEGQVELSKGLQTATAAVDAAGLCLFVAFAVLDIEDAMQTICDLLSAKYGQTFTPEGVMNFGESILKDEHEFNRLAGFTAADDQLPRFFRTDKLPPHDVAWDFTAEELQAAKV